MSIINYELLKLNTYHLFTEISTNNEVHQFNNTNITSNDAYIINNNLYAIIRIKKYYDTSNIIKTNKGSKISSILYNYNSKKTIILETSNCKIINRGSCFEIINIFNIDYLKTKLNIKNFEFIPVIS